MHFEILVEDQSGRNMLDILVPKLIGDQDSIRIHAYKGLGRIPKNMKPNQSVRQRFLLNQLPRILRGYGKTYSKSNFDAAVIVVCDLDNKTLTTFRQELFNVLNSCNPKPLTRFCIAIEEGEAWLLGDITAVKSAYPNAKTTVLDQYVNDSICGTWEKLADAIFPGGHQRLSTLGWQAIGREKSVWAKKIASKMNVNNNASPSFNYFCNKIRQLTI